MKKVIKASTQRRWVPFAFAVALLCSAWLPLSAFAADEVVETQNVNHVRSQGTRMSAQPAGGKFSADKAADGKDDSGDHHDSRWSTSDELPAKDESTYLQATFAKPTRLSYFKIIFETRAEGAPPTPSNVKGFELQYKETDDGPWQKAAGFSRTRTVEGGGYEAVVKLKLGQPINAKAVRLTKFDVLKGSTEWNSVSVAEFEAYTNEQADAVDTENVNHVQGATMCASGQEGDGLGADKAADGDRGSKSRWSSGENVPAKDTDTWLEADLKEASKIQFVDVEFETRNSDVRPSNVRGFEVQYQAPGSDTWTSAQVVKNATSGKGYEPRVRVTLGQPIIAKKIRLTNFDVATGNTKWNGVSVVELEAYTNVQTVNESLDSVISKLNRMGDQTVEAGVTEVALPQVPAGFKVELNGADFEQVIGDDRSVHHPLTDKFVKISWKVSKEGTDEKAVTNDIVYLVKGVNTQPAGKNVKPSVVPEIQEWYSNSDAKLALDAVTAVTYSDAALKPVVDEFVADYKDFTGRNLASSRGDVSAGTIHFALTSPADDALLGDEGYVMEIESDRINVTAPAVTGNMYAMQTILQMTKLDDSGFPMGQMRDYPRFEVRGFMWDVARKPVSLDMMKMATRTMRYYKMNDFQAHLSDNLIFLEDYKTEEEAWKAYAAFRLENSVKNEATGASPTASDYFMSKDEFRDFIQSERALGMNVVPEIDMPAHAVAFTRVWPELAVHGEGLTVNSDRPAIDHFDLRKQGSMDVITSIFDDYTTGPNPVFDENTVVHVGADEFLVNNGSPVYHTFLNELLPHVKRTNTVRMWGGLTWLGQGDPIVDAAINGEHGRTQMNLWSADWADGVKMYEMGFDLINTIDNFGYMVPNGDGSRKDAYGDYLNTNRVFNEFAPERVRVKGGGYKYLPSGDEQMLGAAYAIWNDNIDTRASGLSEADEYARFFDAMPFYAEKTWAPTGKEKGSADSLRSLVAKTGDAPRVNPYSKASKIGDTYAEYAFDNLADGSKNGRDLQQGKKATVEGGKLLLEGGESYVSSPLAKVAAGSELSFDIELTEPACPGDVLFEADAPYGTLDIRVMDNGKLGFTRELYDYYFDYKLPVGKKVNIRIATNAIDGVRPAGNADGAMESTLLYVDGVLVGRANGRFFDADMVKKDGIDNATLTLPLQRIGSKTNAIAAKIDNVRVAPASAVDQFNKAAWEERTNSWTQTGEDHGGHLSHALDGDQSSIWHSNWKDPTEENKNGRLSVTNPIWAEFDFDKAYTINQFSFTPRPDNSSGRVTEASLFIRTEKNGSWKEVAKNVTFKNDASKKTISFPEETVCGIRFEATKSNDDWVAVSEFDIANTPARANTVYAHGKSYAAGTDGALDLATGKAAGQIAGSAEDLDASKPVYRAEVKGGTTVTLTADQVDGLEFVGWFAPCSKEPVSTDASCKVTADHNVALEARYKRIGGDPIVPPAPTKHTVTFLVDDEAVSTAEVVDGKLVAEPAAPKKDGYTFDGWFLGEKKYDFSAPVTEDLTLVAKFTKVAPNPGPEPEPEPQPGPEQQPGDRPDNKPVDKPSSKPSGQSDDKLVATGDVSMAMVGTALVGGMGLVAAGARRRRR